MRHLFTVPPMNIVREVQPLVKACLSIPEHAPDTLLRWLACDVLADLVGLSHIDPPPPEVRDWLRDTAALYAERVTRHPFADLLGLVYQEVASRSKCKGLGQFFTPDPVAHFMGSVVSADARHAGPPARGGLWRACEPCRGSGGLMLGLLQALMEQHGQHCLRHWSVTVIDLDPLCVRLCAAQLLANLLLHGGQLGELVVYEGNALGRREELGVVAHLTLPDLTPDLVLPAMHPARIAALREAARTVTPPSALAPARPARTAKASSVAAPTESSADPVDLFAD
jgi:hypothetical protein